MATVENAKQICFQNGPKITRRHVLYGIENADTGVIYQHIDPTKLRHGVGKQPLDLLVVTHVALKANSARLVDVVQFSHGAIHLWLLASAKTNTYAATH